MVSACFLPPSLGVGQDSTEKSRKPAAKGLKGLGNSAQWSAAQYSGRGAHHIIHQEHGGAGALAQCEVGRNPHTSQKQGIHMALYYGMQSAQPQSLRTQRTRQQLCTQILQMQLQKLCLKNGLLDPNSTLKPRYNSH